jgi:hypothetical protein
MKRLSHRLSQLKINKIKEKKPAEADHTSHHISLLLKGNVAVLSDK